MPGHALVLILQSISLVASGLTAIKLFRIGLSARYRIFFASLLFRVANISWALLLPVKSDLYFYFWVFSEPLVVIFYFWVVWELCGLVLERHRGLTSLGRWAMYFGMAVSVTLSVLTLLPRIQAVPQTRSKIMGYLVALDRGGTFCLAVFLLLMLFLISRYPVPLSRNVVLHATLYTIFFLCNSLNVILNSVFGVTLYTAIDTGLVVVSTGCALAWLFLLGTKGEEVRVTVPRFGPEQEERLLLQLDTLNSTLMKVGRK